MSAKQLDLAMYAVQCFAFLMPQHEAFTLSMLAQAIRSHYDAKEPRTAEVLTVLDAHPDMIGRIL